MGMDEIMQDSDERMDRIRKLSEGMWERFVDNWEPEDGDE